MKYLSTPSRIIQSFCLTFIILTLISSYIGVTKPWLILNENKVLYLYSTSAQVLAAIYGLTLTGFIFFRNELSREGLEDETLAEVTESLKARYFSLLIFVTLATVMTLFISNLSISFNSRNSLIGTIILNSAQSLYLISILSITYFIFEVISPNRIQNESIKLQNQIDPKGEAEKSGSIEQFLRNFFQIEKLIAKYGLKYLNLPSNELNSRNVQRIPNAKLTDILFRNNKINESLYREIKALITLRNSIIHGADPVVSEKIVKDSNYILSELRDALGEIDTVNN